MAKDKSKKIIIKKVKKGGHGGHHGGSWKVAYADFVTAMMAFFLLMWLLSMTPADTKKALSDYFQRFTVFQKGGAALLDSGSSGATNVVPSDGVPDSLMRVEDTLLEVVDEAVHKRLPQELKENVSVEKAEDGGFRVQIVDKEGRPLFASGKAELTPQGREILKAVTAALMTFDNRVSVEGHTDSQAHAADPYRNWDLSLERASAARRELQRQGFDPARIEQVSGFAAGKPYVADNPADPRNRRVSLLVHLPERPAPENGQPRTAAAAKAPFTEALKDVLAPEPDASPKPGAEAQPQSHKPTLGETLEARVRAAYEATPPAPRQ